MKELELLRPVDLEGWELLERHGNTAVGGRGISIVPCRFMPVVGGRCGGPVAVKREKRGVWDGTKEVKNSSEIFKSCTSLPSTD